MAVMTIISLLDTVFLKNIKYNLLIESVYFFKVAYFIAPALQHILEPDHPGAGSLLFKSAGDKMKLYISDILGDPDIEMGEWR